MASLFKSLQFCFFKTVQKVTEPGDLHETSRGPEARQREGALKFIGGPMSPFLS